MRSSLKALVVLAGCLAALGGGPAWGCSASVDDLGPEVYCGKYRGGVKTTFYKTPDGRLGTMFQYPSLADLLDSIPTDDDMRQLTRNWRRGEGPPTRFPDEQMNVEVPVYLVAVSLGEDDHDLHVIVSDSARGRNRDFMNVEVSGLPRNRVDEGLFARARTQISGILSSVDMTRMGSYLRIDPPLPVLVQGSLFFDGDHEAGCSHCPGPNWAKPQTVWEIHPVYSITAQRPIAR